MIWSSSLTTTSKWKHQLPSQCCQVPVQFLHQGLILGLDGLLQIVLEQTEPWVRWSPADCPRADRTLGRMVSCRVSWSRQILRLDGLLQGVLEWTDPQVGRSPAGCPGVGRSFGQAVFCGVS